VLQQLKMQFALKGMDHHAVSMPAKTIKLITSGELENPSTCTYIHMVHFILKQTIPFSTANT
jgi:hypothetical protein